MIFIDRLLKNLKPQYDDDGVDRLNYYFTPMILVGFAILILAKQHFGEPMQCWAPAQYTEPWEKYAESHCFTLNTYFLSPKETLPGSVEEREDKEIAYYQWVPIVLAIQAFLFLLPQLVWRYCSKSNGMDVKSIVKMAKDTSILPVDRRKEPITIVAGHISSAVADQQRLKNNGLFFSIPYSGASLTVLYLLVKVLYLIQVSCQFFLLNSFLGTSTSFWGYRILMDLLHGRAWEESGQFPRVTFCDFDTYALGTKHTRTLQCVLVVNMYNEKFFMFLWFWMIALFFLTALNLILWIIQMSSEIRRAAFLMSFIRLQDGSDYDRLLNCTRFLGVDGILLLRLISKNCGDLVASDIIGHLWTTHGNVERSLYSQRSTTESISDDEQKTISHSSSIGDIEMLPQP